MLLYKSEGFYGHVAGHVIFNLHPVFAAFLAFSACAALFFTRRPARNLAVASMLSAGLGYALSFVAGFLIKLPYIFMVGALVAKILQDMRIRFRVDKTSTHLYLLIFWMLAIISSIYTFQAPYLFTRGGMSAVHGLPIRSLIQNLQLALMLSFFYVTYQYCKERENWRQMVRFFGFCTLFAVGYGIYELLTLYFPGIPYLNLALPGGSLGGYKAGGDSGGRNFILYRMHGFFNEPAGMASYLLFAIPLLTGEFFMAPKTRKPLKLIFLISSVIALLLTTSNAAFVAAILGSVSVLFFLKKIKPIIFVMVLFFGVPWAAQELLQKAVIQKTEDEKVEVSPSEHNLIAANLNETLTVRNYRYEVWSQALEVFKKNPIFGIGLGNYSFWFDSGSVESTTSLFMQILVELGSVGMLVFLLFLGSIVWDLRRLLFLRKQDPEIYIYAVAMIGCLFAGFAHRMSFDALTIDPLTWVLLGMAAALPRIPYEEARARMV